MTGPLLVPHVCLESVPDWSIARPSTGQEAMPARTGEWGGGMVAQKRGHQLGWNLRLVVQVVVRSSISVCHCCICCYGGALPDEIAPLTGSRQAAQALMSCANCCGCCTPAACVSQRVCVHAFIISTLLALWLGRSAHWAGASTSMHLLFCLPFLCQQALVLGRLPPSE